MKLVNRTPHTIVLATPVGDIQVAPSEPPLRAETQTVDYGDLELSARVGSPSVPLVAVHLDLDEVAYELVNAPEGELAIVSSALLDGFETNCTLHRKALNRCCAPDTSPGSVQRNADGTIRAVARLRVRWT